MNRFLLCLLLVAPAAFNAQDNPDYNPDFNGDGCYSINDILGFLPLFGLCPGADVDSSNAISLGAENSYYDPDFNGDGCYSVHDMIGLLPLFGRCWECGDPLLYDSYYYGTVLIDDQCWFSENLRTTIYSDGSAIPMGLSGGECTLLCGASGCVPLSGCYGEWTNANFGASAIYGEGNMYCGNLNPDIDACDEAQSLAEYGRLYNWHSVDDARGLCPAEWHVSTESDWDALGDYILSLGIGSISSTLKSTSGWYTSTSFGDGNGTDNFGFAARPGGYRSLDGSSWSSGEIAYFWSPCEECDHPNRTTYITYAFSSIFSEGAGPLSGRSVRCLKDD